jgi:hypothetical protein
MPRKIFVAGEILTAADLQANAVDQSVMVFDDAAARTTAIPSPIEGMVTYLKDTDAVEVFKGAAFAPVGGGFTDSETITATDASWPVPTLASPIVKVTAIGGGGAGGRTSSTNGNAGGTTTFNAGGAGTVTAAGGVGGLQGRTNDVAGVDGTVGFAAGNHGGGSSTASEGGGKNGHGGVITVAYLNLAGISTVNVTIGAGGLRTASGGGSNGSGGRGEVIVEYVAG